MTLNIRPLVDADADGLIALISGCFAEYEGTYIDLDDLDSDLLSYESNLKAQGGQGFVAVDAAGAIHGSVACAPSGEARFELKRLYLNSSLRGTGIGLKLLHTVEDIARASGAIHMDAWSDTRFLRAHRFYEREGYRRGPHTRDLNDISNSVEYYFIKQL